MIISANGALRQPATVQALRARHSALDDELNDALIALMFAETPEALAQPLVDTPASEGWIWVPKDSLRPHKSA